MFVQQPRRAGLAGLAEWYRSDFGHRFAASECALLARILPMLFGYHAACLGRLGGADWLAASRIAHRFTVQVPGLGDGGDLAAEPRTLPLRSDILDLIVVPHLLEFVEDPETVLAELERVLIAEGHVVILGFNPLAEGGVWRLAGPRGSALPPRARLIGSARIAGWLARTGFATGTVDFHCYWPRLRGLRRYPGFGACGYVVVGKKRVSTLTPVLPRWQARRRLLPAGVVGGATRAPSAAREPLGRRP